VPIRGPTTATAEPHFFASAAQWRAWLAEHHDIETELLVGFWRKSTGRPSMTWSEAVDEALCFGWIDGVRRGVDDESYAIRFTRRRPTSTWSEVNVAKVAHLESTGRMTPAGRAAFAERRAERTGIYSYEQADPADLRPDELTAMRENAVGWAFWVAQPAGYRRTATHWITSAKREDTRARRLATLIADCSAQVRLPQLRR
jgi:uncharacterized protein YdeI (YjbR/CyaY-like superfamily)